MHRLKPTGPVDAGSVNVHPGKDLAVPPEAAPSYVLANGYSSHWSPLMLGAELHAVLRFKVMTDATVVRWRGLSTEPPGRPDAIACEMWDTMAGLLAEEYVTAPGA